MKEESTIELSQLPCLTKTLNHLRTSNSNLITKLTVDEIQDITRVANAYLKEFLETSQFVNYKMKDDIIKIVLTNQYVEHFNS